MSGTLQRLQGYIGKSSPPHAPLINLGVMPIFCSEETEVQRGDTVLEVSRVSVTRAKGAPNPAFFLSPTTQGAGWA